MRQAHREEGYTKETISTATRKQNRVKTSPLIPPPHPLPGSEEEIQPCCHLGLEPIKLILDIAYQILKNNFLLFQATKSMAICHGSPGN